jgi:hypothetical protein
MTAYYSPDTGGQKRGLIKYQEYQISKANPGKERFEEWRSIIGWGWVYICE